ncbi:FDLD family class I lanthipeptide [Tumebacillus flagellatus]|nr:FDLD family class I lanthipeptide [Tumebacillus flagellatus]
MEQLFDLDVQVTRHSSERAVAANTMGCLTTSNLCSLLITDCITNQTAM